MFVIVLLPSEFVSDLDPFEEALLLNSLIYATIWIPVESLMISKVGTTPMKWAFGISVRMQDGRYLKFSEAMKRTYLCFIQGEGLGIPFVTLITRLFAYQRLKQTNSTLWDTEVGSMVCHKSFTLWRIIGCVALGILTTFMIGVFNSIGG